MNKVERLITQLPLKEMGPELLAEGIRIATVNFTRDYDFASVDKALVLAAYLHRNQTRSNRGDLPRDPYITHPYRNALRLLRAGVKRPSLVTAAVLHDTVEDCLDEMSALAGLSPDLFGTFEKRQAVYAYLEAEYGEEVTKIIAAVTNPLPDPTAPKLSQAQRREAYAKHVTEQIAEPKAALVKLVDFVDNALGLKHNAANPHEAPDHGMISHLSQKYLPLLPVFQQTIERKDVKAYISEDGYLRFKEQLQEGSKTLASLALLR